VRNFMVETLTSMRALDEDEGKYIIFVALQLSTTSNGETQEATVSLLGDTYDMTDHLTCNKIQTYGCKITLRLRRTSQTLKKFLKGDGCKCEQDEPR